MSNPTESPREPREARTVSGRMQAVRGPTQNEIDEALDEAARDFGNLPITNPRIVIQQQAPAASAPPTPPATPHAGITLPMWIIQLIPIVALIAGAVTAFATQKADVDQIKTSVTEIKTAQHQQAQSYVQKEIFDLKVKEQERSLNQIEKSMDRLEGLVNGIYERLPPKNNKEQH